MMNYDYLVDASGDSCPMPLLKAKRQLNTMKSGECLKVIATDAASVRDFSSFIALTGHNLQKEQLEQDSFIYYIIKA
jgi:TusA-related sulfurtransferase